MISKEYTLGNASLMLRFYFVFFIFSFWEVVDLRSMLPKSREDGVILRVGYPMITFREQYSFLSPNYAISV